MPGTPKPRASERTELDAATQRAIASTPIADEIEFLAIKAFAAGTRLINSRLQELGLRARSYSLLAVSCSPVQLTQRELASLLELDPSQIVALVDELIDQGMVVRETDPRDRRGRIVRATSHGRELFERARAVAMQSEADALVTLNASERDTLRRLLRQIVFPASGT